MTAAVKVAVIGGGIAGLAAAHRLHGRLGGDELVLLEAEDRLGGKIATERTGGYVIEGGPDCFLAAKPAGVELCRQLGLADRLRGTDRARRRSFVRRGGRLHELPDGLTGLVPSRIRPLMTTGILSPAGRLRAAGEPLLPRRRAGAGDESIASFVSRRFGREAYDWLVEPLLSGIFAGDGEALSLGATFPQLAAAERQHGSVLLPMLRARFRRARPSTVPAGFVTPESGLAELVEALERRLAPAQVWLGARVVELGALEQGWRLALEDGRTIHAGTVICALPAHAAAALLDPVDAPLGEALGGIPFVSTATVSVAFPTGAVPVPFEGTGYVSPRREGGSVVACTWTSNKFPSRVPAGGVLLRFFLGRAGREDPALAGDGEIRRIVRRELETVHGITAEPSLWRIYRWPRGLPQYTLGHLDRLATIEDRVRALPGLLLAGCSYRGVGIPDCIASGWAAADAAARAAAPVPA